MAVAWAGWSKLETLSAGFTSFRAAVDRDGLVDTFCIDGQHPARQFLWSDGVHFVNLSQEWPTPRPTSVELAARFEDGLVEAFGVTAAGELWQIRQREPAGVWAAEWERVYPDPDEPIVAVSVANGVIDPSSTPHWGLSIFALGRAGHIGHLRQASSGGPWTGSWRMLYTDRDRLNRLKAVTHADGRVELVGIAPDGRIWHTWQVKPPADWVGHWSELYTDHNRLSALDAALNADGRLEVFGVASDHRIWHTWQTSPGGDWNGSWLELYTGRDRLSALKVARTVDGDRLHVFGLSPTGEVWHTWQTTHDGNWNGSWVKLPAGEKRLSAIDAMNNQHDRLEVYALDPQGRLWRTSELPDTDG